MHSLLEHQSRWVWHLALEVLGNHQVMRAVTHPLQNQILHHRHLLDVKYMLSANSFSSKWSDALTVFLFVLRGVLPHHNGNFCRMYIQPTFVAPEWSFVAVLHHLILLWMCHVYWKLFHSFHVNRLCFQYLSQFQNLSLLNHDTSAGS